MDPTLIWTSLSLHVACGIGSCLIIFFTECWSTSFAIWGGELQASVFCFTFFFQRDSLLFSSTPQPQHRGLLSLPSSPKLTFYSKLIIILLETLETPFQGSQIYLQGHSHWLPTVITSFTSSLFWMGFDPMYRGSMLWLCENWVSLPLGCINDFHFSAHLWVTSSNTSLVASNVAAWLQLQWLGK